MAQWLNSWLAEQDVRGSIPGPASKSRYRLNIAKSSKTTNQHRAKLLYLYILHLIGNTPGYNTLTRKSRYLLSNAQG